MAWGVPVVATANPGADDLLRAGQAGLIVEPVHLGESLANLLSDVGLQERLADAGRARASEFRWDAICSQYERAYALASERHRA
jgi:glycosyltransferase involved in cell wall biosynthesis